MAASTSSLSGDKILLHWGSGSYYAWRIQIVLEEKNLPYESHLISFAKRENKSEEMVALNPRGQVPVLQVGDTITICESGAACEFLDSMFPSSAKLIPDDPKGKAAVLQAMWEAHSNIPPVFMSLVYSQLEDAALQEKREAFKIELSRWDTKLAGRQFAAGDSFTMADVFLYPFVATFVRFGFDYAKSGMPNLAGYHERLSARESCKKTVPPHWSEGPGNGRLAF